MFSLEPGDEVDTLLIEKPPLLWRVLGQKESVSPDTQQSPIVDHDLSVDGAVEDEVHIAGDAFILPYKTYRLLKGPHGYSYGHYAWDLTAGKGAEIRSPIEGTVIGRAFDGYGNSVLKIANEQFIVTMLHGAYTVDVDEHIVQGQVLGFESNIGYTTDGWGRNCSGRECGFHTHITVFDRTIGRNVHVLRLAEGVLVPQP